MRNDCRARSRLDGLARVPPGLATGSLDFNLESWVRVGDSNNFADLEKLLRDNGASERSFALRAAATDICPTSTIKVQRPLFEEKNPNSPHWLRRQIGGIIKAGKGVRSEWTMEEVKCGTFHPN